MTRDEYAEMIRKRPKLAQNQPLNALSPKNGLKSKAIDQKCVLYSRTAARSTKNAQSEVLFKKNSKGVFENSVCIICNNAFYASPGQRREGGGKYCSMECRSKAYQGIGNPRFNHDHKASACLKCGALFRVKPYAWKNGEGKFCSTKCWHETLPEKISKICKFCGCQFEVHKSHSATTCCSVECSSKSRRTLPDRICKMCGVIFRSKGSGKIGVNSFCSLKCKYRKMSSTQLTVSGANRNTKGGKREDLNGQYFRSRWEANYARYLNWLKSHGEIISWEFEPDTFEFIGIKRGVRFYTPDFKIVQKDGSIIYHEIKGWMDPRSITRHKRMSKRYPQVIVRLILGQEYHAIAKKVKSIIPHWE